MAERDRPVAKWGRWATVIATAVGAASFLDDLGSWGRGLRQAWTYIDDRAWLGASLLVLGGLFGLATRAARMREDRRRTAELADQADAADRAAVIVAADEVIEAGRAFRVTWEQLWKKRKLGITSEEWTGLRDAFDHFDSAAGRLRYGRFHTACQRYSGVLMAFRSRWHVPDDGAGIWTDADEQSLGKVGEIAGILGRLASDPDRPR